ncbi:TetR/AcrR family transcriptional regulator [Mycetocola manganoxydans]|uniref:TetR/AcrR family transcriptional regulator n=1 Tax=Mycetocola manganoxydans TaxID=699879 RepID=A0A3L6ZPF1_9MICO|nr:TetR/AcrR family transcriptional regulator [Mycetocola manganoxydans]RLP69790.1 TetR/AcrR family transcriptional regulator [Mycetocola manganoxydans]GHD50036.1 putative transcriptional regulator, TetR family protein [Mycetocola manganoxydans]
MVDDTQLVRGPDVSDSGSIRVGRSEAKAQRREALLNAAASQFAERGFNGVSIEDLGSAVGMSGPAVYRHFESKQALLAAILIDVSRELLHGGTTVVERAPDGELALRALVEFHVRFALSNPDVIRVQDRDFDSLSEEDRHTVRSLQRRYVELWVDILQRMQPDTKVAVLRIRAHATFGLMNSTPYSGQQLPRDELREVLERMAFAALS